MSDILGSKELWKQRRRDEREGKDAQIAWLQELAARAVLQPESLTTAETQEVGWGCLIALDKLLRPKRRSN